MSLDGANRNCGINELDKIQSGSVSIFPIDPLLRSRLDFGRCEETVARDVNYDFIADGCRLGNYPRRYTEIFPSGSLKLLLVSVVDPSLDDV